MSPGGSSVFWQWVAPKRLTGMAKTQQGPERVIIVSKAISFPVPGPSELFWLSLSSPLTQTPSDAVSLMQPESFPYLIPWVLVAPSPRWLPVHQFASVLSPMPGVQPPHTGWCPGISKAKPRQTLEVVPSIVRVWILWDCKRDALQKELQKNKIQGWARTGVPNVVPVDTMAFNTQHLWHPPALTWISSMFPNTAMKFRTSQSRKWHRPGRAFI